MPPPHGCLKTKSTSSATKKDVHVDWSDEDDVHTADDWDRTAVEPAKQPLSYSDILELKDIQSKLPRANQPEDPFAAKKAVVYLSRVPMVLVPLGPA